MPILIRYEDGLTPFLQRVIAEKPQWVGSALKSAGFWAKKEIDAGIRSGAPGGRAYVKGMSPARRRELDDIMANPGYRRAGNQSLRHPRRSYQHMGELRKAVKYDKTRANEGKVTVGWTSRSAVRLGSFQEKGMFQHITDKMRKLFFAAGIGLKKGTNTIALPVRATYDSMRPVIERGAPKQVERKLINYLLGSTERSQARSKRVYHVYQ